MFVKKVYRSLAANRFLLLLLFLSLKESLDPQDIIWDKIEIFEELTTLGRKIKFSIQVIFEKNALPIHNGNFTVTLNLQIIFLFFSFYLLSWTFLFPYCYINFFSDKFIYFYTLLFWFFLNIFYCEKNKKNDPKVISQETRKFLKTKKPERSIIDKQCF